MIASLIVVWWGFSIGWTVRRTAKQRDDIAEDPFVLGSTVWMSAAGLVYGLLQLAGVLTRLLHH